MWNFDETMLAWGSQMKAVVIPRSCKKATAIIERYSEHITLGLCVSAAGDHMLPLIILPLKTLPKSCDDLIPFCGWITKEIFHNWLLEVLVPHINSIRKNNEPALLWVDGHSSRSNLEAIELLRKHNITMATIPSHTSTLLQPLDRGVNKTFKGSVRKLKPSRLSSCRTEARVELLSIAKDALYDAHAPRVIITAWRMTGLWPWNPSQVLGDYAQVNILPPPPPPKRNALSISGKVITSDNFAREMKDQEEKKLEKKMKKRREMAKKKDEDDSKPTPKKKSKKQKTDQNLVK